MTKKSVLLRLVLLLMLIQVIEGSVMAQGRKRKKEKKTIENTDTLQAYRQFVSMGNQYKQLPLQMEMEIVRYETVAGINTDTMRARASFYLQEKASYLRIEDQEQLANDTILLQINKQAQRMILSRHSQTVAGQLQKLIGWQLRDSSLQQLAKGYRGIVISGTDNIDTVRLWNRINLAGMNKPLDEVEMLYDTRQQRPVEVITYLSQLLPLEKELYEKWKDDPSKSAALVMKGDKETFVLRIQTTYYRFDRIDHDPAFVLPVLISDRIVPASDGTWVPANGYEDYRITRR